MCYLFRDGREGESPMARKPRYYLSGVPCHVIQRGNNRQPCFFAEADYGYYLGCLQDAADRYQCSVHAYVLMTNHVHLLMSPSDGTGISRVMQSVGRRYVQYVNRRYERSGTLWEGRHRASLVDSETYLLACYRYIELNPVRAGMVECPEDYRWSSYRAHALGDADRLVADHATFLALGDSEAERQAAYRDLFVEHARTADTNAIRDAAELCVPLGSDRFKAGVEQQLGQPISYRRRGRPGRTSEDKEAGNGDDQMSF